MLDIRFVRENPDLVKENIKKKFQEDKLPLVDQVIALDKENRETVQAAQDLRASRNTLSKQVGMLMGQAKKDPSKLEEAEALKAQVTADAQRLTELEERERVLAEEIRAIIDSAYERCRAILTAYRPQLVAVAEYLLAHETMDAETFESYFTGDGAAKDANT